MRMLMLKLSFQRWTVSLMKSIYCFCLKSRVQVTEGILRRDLRQPTTMICDLIPNLQSYVNVCTVASAHQCCWYAYSSYNYKKNERLIFSTILHLTVACRVIYNQNMHHITQKYDWIHISCILLGIVIIFIPLHYFFKAWELSLAFAIFSMMHSGVSFYFYLECSSLFGAPVFNNLSFSWNLL